MKAQRRAIASRADDERVLRMLAERERGLTSPQIGAAFGTTGSSVRTILQRVDRDLALSERRTFSMGWLPS